MSAFSQQEYDRRLRRTRKRLRDRDLDGLLVSIPENINYLTGYAVWSHHTPQCLLVPAAEDRLPVLYLREFDERGAEYTTWLPDGRIRSYGDVRGYPDAYVAGERPHPMATTADLFEELGLEGGRVGLEMNGFYFDARSYEEVTTAVDADFQDASLLVKRVRAVKSDAELRYMREAAELTRLGMDAARDAIEPGVAEAEVAAAIYEATVAGTDDFGGEFPATPPLLPTGEKVGIPHFWWSADDHIAPGDPVMMEVCGCRHRYHVPITRTVYAGDPPAAAQETVELLRAGYEAALDAIEPGVTCETVERAWRAALPMDIDAHEARIGYAMGLGISPGWLEDAANFRMDDETVLEPGMTFHMFPNPTAWLDVSLELSETVVVTEDGAEPFVDYPFELFVA